jgi:peptidyl-prolyl cis-trans isomerase A (cyclophilin A)
MQNWTLIGRRALLTACASLMLPLSAMAEGNPTVQFKTSMGDFTVEVYPDKAPKTVANFLQYVKAKHYDGTIFHRVIDGFMVQTGCYTFSMGEKSTRPPIPLEANNGLTNDRGTLAMARTGNPNSATSQFFINVKDNASLNAKGDADGYAVFGKVIAGMDVIDKIRVVPTGNKSIYQNVPLTPIIITSATLVK